MEKIHIRLKLFAKIAIAILSISFLLAFPHAMAQGMAKIDKTKLVGSWTLVSINNTLPDGKTMQGFGPNDGIVVFEPNGKFVQALARSDLPKIASNNRSTGSSEENKAIISGSLTLFGTYTVTDDGTLTLHMERSTFPNWNGSDQKRTIATLTADELKWHNPGASIGGTTETVWKRNK
jgi:hypothetical protein